MTINIIGAGMAGLLAANMLHRHSPRVFEAAPSLPNNHSAVLRFRTDRVAEVLGISFKKVQLIKTAAPWLNPVADTLMYAMKTGGTYRSDRSINTDVERGERWIAPGDLISRMAKGIEINYNYKMQPIYKVRAEADRRGIDVDVMERIAKSEGLLRPAFSEPVISTIPMPTLMEILDYPHRPEFNYIQGANIIARAFHCDAYASVYIPSPENAFNRVSITGDGLIIEYAFPQLGAVDSFFSIMLDQSKRNTALLDQVARAAWFLGIEAVYPESIEVKRQQYAKIQPIPDEERKRFMAWATDNHNIYSLGRFATWRPGLLLDDLINDIRHIERWIKSGNYGARFKR